MRGFLGFICLFSLAACQVLNPTLPPTHRVSGPTLAPSPIVRIQSSDELYANSSGGQNDPTAAALPNDSNLPPLAVATRAANGAELVQLSLPTGPLIMADLYEYLSEQFVLGPDLTTQERARVPAVLLLGADKLAWGDFPARLSAVGFTVMVVPLHPTFSVADVQTVLVSLSEVSTVDPNRMALMGALAGADLALAGCAVNSLCDAVALFSPLGQVATVNDSAALGTRPLLIAASQDNPSLYGQALALGAGATTPTFFEYPTGQGEGLLALYPDLTDTVISWLQEHLS